MIFASITRVVKHFDRACYGVYFVVVFVAVLQNLTVFFGTQRTRYLRIYHNRQFYPGTIIIRTKIGCVHIGEYMVSGPIVGPDFYGPPHLVLWVLSHVCGKSEGFSSTCVNSIMLRAYRTACSSFGYCMYRVLKNQLS